MTWQPIATAPKGEFGNPETDVLLVNETEGIPRIGRVVSAPGQFMKGIFSSELDFGDFTASAYWPSDNLPTHWQPLPQTNDIKKDEAA